MNKPKKTFYDAHRKLGDRWLELVTLLIKELRLAEICGRLNSVIVRVTKWLNRRVSMNRREFMKTAVAVAATIGVGGVVDTPDNEVCGSVIRIMQNGDVIVDGVRKFTAAAAKDMEFLATEAIEWEMPENPGTITNALRGFNGPISGLM